MKPFFTTLAEALKDRQEVRINIKKIAGDLVILAVMDFKDEGKPVSISGTPAAMDLELIDELLKPLSVITTFSSNADEVKKEIEEELAEDEETDKKAAAKKANKSKSSSKKAPAKATKPVKKSAKEIKEEKNREAFDKLIGVSRAFISESKFKEAIKNLKAALKLFPKNDDAIKLLAEATEAAKAPKVKPSKKESNPEINFDTVNNVMKDQAAEKSDENNNTEETELKALKEADQELYDKLTEEGRIAYDEKDYHTALLKYKEASELDHISDNQKRTATKIFESASLAFDKANEAKKAEEAENTNLAKYNAAMIQGKEEMVAKNYEAAVKCFEDATAIYPHYQEAIDSLAKAKQLLDAFNLLNT